MSTLGKRQKIMILAGLESASKASQFSKEEPAVVI